jgi:3-isopropylmalate dehydratase large subunit
VNEIECYLAKAAGKETVKCGEDITVNIELAIAHDVTGPLALEQFAQIGVKQVFDPNKIVFVLDHVFPAATIAARHCHRQLNDFAKQYGVRSFHNGEGVVHQIVAEELMLPRGAVMIGADSHTCTAGAYGVLAFGVGSTELAAAMATGTIDIEVPPVQVIELNGCLNPGVYAKDIILHLIGTFGTDGFTDQAVIFSGSWVRQAALDEKMTISNMAIEMGAMLSYFSLQDTCNPEAVTNTHQFAVQHIAATVACPPSPGNAAPLSKVAGVPISQVVIGSCTNGRLSDMQVAAEVLGKMPVHPDVTCIILPASRKIAAAMEEQGLTKIFRQAGAVVTNPGCGPCYGGHLGLVTAEDVVVATTNRNFPGRMGAKEAKIYLASPRAAAEAAVAGKLVVPGTVVPLGGKV